MADQKDADEGFDRIAYFLRFCGATTLTPGPEPKPTPVQEEVEVEDSDDELPPPPPIDPNHKPIYARDLVKNVQPKPAVQMACDALDFTMDPRKGQAAPLGMCFCPFIAVTKYCYKFVPKKLMQPLATAFFDAEKIWNREWDLYYISSSYGGVFTFVSEHQLRGLLDEINIAFPDAKLRITDEDREGGLVLDFEDVRKDLRPRFLGHCNSRSKHNAWVQQIEALPNMVIPDSADRSIEAFKAKIDAANAINKNKSKASKARKLQENVLKRNEMVKQGSRSQRYLGLRRKSEESLVPDLNQLTLDPLDTSKPVPHPFDSEPIFISIDVEANEIAPFQITEIGVATLDTRDLKGTAPGECGRNWFQFIRARHLRTAEYTSICNHKYVQGCPDSFEFGESEKVAKDSLATVLATCFREPYSKTSSKEDDFPPLGSSKLNPRATTFEPETRNIVVVGHDLGQDVNYCRQIGYNILNRGNIIDQADTANMYRSYANDPNARSLGSILYDFDIPGWHLHNAGNDAVYTLQAMLAICVQTAADGKEGEKKRAEESYQKREEKLIEGAKERAFEDSQGWDSSGDDGGIPIKPPVDSYQKKAFGPERPPAPQTGLYTMGGAPLDV
ncbi:hypothetical protein PRZ48_002365 [Zasmidium cellare]|uniref:Gfd2/YDR514C-like C-terminal domain-containing protein n=1 Tax=Zasmidium cellare TaxID=395010 RepID=A0ABR0F5Z2_ZASCE|nr:hypothetical protein PRZ48_002365 [Zasmidium cellare]